MQDQTLDNQKVNQEISGKPWWKTCLIVSVFVILIFIVVSFLFVRFFGGSGPKYTNRLPPSFPTNFILYRMGLVKQIVYYPATEKDKPIRLIMTPVRLIVGMTSQGKAMADSIDRFLGVVRSSETVTISWENVDANAEEVASYYADAMRTAGVIDPQMRQTSEKDISQLVGMTDAGLKIDVLIVDNKNTPPIDAITVVVEYPAKK